jgi:hypothetical protein
LIISCEKQTESKSTIQLFDGKTFTGWEGDLNWFRIEQGAIVAGSLDKEIPHNYFLCTTRDFSDFELKVEAKLVGERPNSGVQFRSRRVPGETEVSGYQADIGNAIGEWSTVWGSLYDESRRNKMLIKANDEEVLKVLRADTWNEMVLRCQGANIMIKVNGLKTVEYTEDDPSIEQNGVIGLQIHSGPPGEVWFRNITITEL